MLKDTSASVAQQPYCVLLSNVATDEGRQTVSQIYNA